MKEISLDGMKLLMPDDFKGGATSAFDNFMNDREDNAYRQAVNDCLAVIGGIEETEAKLRNLLADWEKRERPPHMWMA